MQMHNNSRDLGAGLVSFQSGSLRSLPSEYMFIVHNIHVYASGWFSVRVVVSIFHSLDFCLPNVDATQWMGWDVNVPCTCTHVGCYAMDQTFAKKKATAYLHKKDT